MGSTHIGKSGFLPFLVSIVLLLFFPDVALGTESDIAERWFAVHSEGLQRLGMRNNGEIGNPDHFPAWIPNLEYPGGSGTVFLFSGGLWVGAMRDGEPIVSVCTDGDNGTNEFGPLEFAADDDRQIEDIGSVGWLEKGIDSASTFPNIGFHDSNYFSYYRGSGTRDKDDDADGLIDEDPAGDISRDYQDNDGDGLVDEEDPDLDGDVVPGSRDDDGDGLIDEDDCAVADQELITAYVDTCESCINSPDQDGFTPLGIRVVQHTYQWKWKYADDFIVMDFEITNISDSKLYNLAAGYFTDFDIGHMAEQGTGYTGGDDATMCIDSVQLGVGFDSDGDNGRLSAMHMGISLLEHPNDQSQFTYRNFDRLAGGDPEINLTKYDLLCSGDIDTTGMEENDWRFVVGTGPLCNLRPGETTQIAFAIVNGVELEDLIRNAIQARNFWNTNFLGPTAPIDPTYRLSESDRSIHIAWDNIPEHTIDPLTGLIDFQGYNILRNDGGEDWVLIATYDLPDTIGYNMGWPPPECPEEGFAYQYHDTGLLNGRSYRYAVTAFDDGDNGDGIHTEAWDERNGGIGVMESSREHAQAIVPAGGPAVSIDDVYVVPNPYRGNWLLEGDEERLDFRELPSECEITVYTVAGDLVREINHSNGLSWESWDLKNDDGKSVAGGIYLYRVQGFGKERIGKFVVVR